MSFRPLICKIRCHNPNRSGSKNANRNYLTYIATREGVDLSPSDDINKLLENQKILHTDLNDEFIYKEADNMKYLQYINFRPKSHGLFGNVDTSDLKALSNQVAELTKSRRNIYRGIVSLSQPDAEALGFTDKKQWEDYLKQVMPDIAKELGVSSTNFTWVAAFHAEKSHPHIHFELWDNNDAVKSPFIHVSVQHSCRNLLSKTIFNEEYENMVKGILQVERNEINKIRNANRNEILDNVKELVNIFDDIPASTLPDRISVKDVEEILPHLEKLLDTLPVSGSIDYAYLTKPIKKQVDDINALLLKRPDMNRALSQYIKAIEEGNKLDGKNKFEIRKNVDNSIADINKRMGNIVLKKAKELKMMEINLLDIFSSIRENIDSEENNTAGVIGSQGTISTTIDNRKENDFIERSLEIESNNGTDENNIIESDFEPIDDIELYDPKEELNSDDISPDLTDMENLNETISSLLEEESEIDYSRKEKVTCKPPQNQFQLKKEHQNPIKSPEGYHISWNTNYKKALDYIYGDNKDFHKALNILAKEAAGKNVLAIHDLGKIYEKGLGVEINIDKADTFYRKAYKGFLSIENTKPHKYVEYRLGKLFNSGKGVEKDYSEASDWYKLSTDENYKYAQYSLGVLYRNGLGIPTEEEGAYIVEALSLFEKSAAQTNAYASFEAAKMYEKGIGTKVDKGKSEFYYRGAFNGFLDMLREREDDAILYRVGHMYYNGIGTDKDEKEGIFYLEKSAELNNVNALYLLSKIYLKENDSEKIEKAISILKKLVEADNDMAQYSLGKIYLDGKYIDKDIEKGLNLLHKAANHNSKLNEKGNQFAQYQLGKMYYRGEEMEKNLELSISYLNLSAEQKNDMSMFQLGKIYSDKESEVYNIDTAVSWFEKSAEKGNQFAQYELGKMYYKGEELPRDIDRAVEYLNKAIDQDNDMAMYLKGRIYADEDTEVYDIKTAISWYEKAAEKGNQFAQYQLGVMYLWGRKIPKDEEKGIYWLEKAMEQGNEYAKEALDMYYRYSSHVITGTAFSIIKNVFSGILQQNNDARSDSSLYRTQSKQARKEQYLKNKIRSSYLDE